MAAERLRQDQSYSCYALLPRNAVIPGNWAVQHHRLSLAAVYYSRDIYPLTPHSSLPFQKNIRKYISILE